MMGELLVVGFVLCVAILIACVVYVVESPDKEYDAYMRERENNK